MLIAVIYIIYYTRKPQHKNLVWVPFETVLVYFNLGKVIFLFGFLVWVLLSLHWVEILVSMSLGWVIVLLSLIVGWFQQMFP